MTGKELQALQSRLKKIEQLGKMLEKRACVQDLPYYADKENLRGQVAGITYAVAEIEKVLWELNS